MLPGIVLNILSAATPRTIPTDTGQCFAAGVLQRGSIVKPTLCRSMQDVANASGQRLASSSMYDWSDTYFGEGGTKLWLSRAVATNAVQASLNLMDTVPAIALVIKAATKGDADPGVWANGAAGGLSVAVVASGTSYQLQTFLNGQLVESSPLLSTQQDAVNWSNHPQLGSLYISASLGVGVLPPAPAGAANLAGGTDGSTVGSTERQAALDRIPVELGPGQVCLPGVTTSADQLYLMLHGFTNRRWPLIDGPDTPTATTLVAAAAALYGAPNVGRRWGEFHAPWDVIPGLTQYSSRTVPPSARQAAQYAKVDALGNPNQAAAGDPYGVAQYVQDLSQPNWSAADRLALNTAGVNISRRRFGGTIETFGARTLADQSADGNWSWASNVRTVMWYAAQAHAATEKFEFRQVDGFGHTLSDWKGALTAPAQKLLALGALFADSPDNPSSAFLVDTGPGLNPLAQLVQGIGQAAVKLRTSPGMEQAVINIFKTPITQSV